MIMAEKTDILVVEGVIQKSDPNATFWVLVETGPESLIGKELLCRLAGRMKMHRIRVMPGDRVRMEVSTYDLSKGRIVFRM